MKCGVVVFPGSNCDHDCFHILRHVFKLDTEWIWHKDNVNLSKFGLIVLPGGYSYGDYLRAGAIAQFSSVMKGLHTELKEAKEQGNESKVSELNAKGPALQAKAHQQGFGNAPIDDIIERIEKELPQIAKQAGVDLILSKWNLDFQVPGAKCIDVTDLMVKPFSPTKETLKVIKDVQKQDPVPLEVLKEHKH